jgi:hypothetical protein
MSAIISDRSIRRPSPTSNDVRFYVAFGGSPDGGFGYHGSASEHTEYDANASNNFDEIETVHVTPLRPQGTSIFGQSLSD